MSKGEGMKGTSSGAWLRISIVVAALALLLVPAAQAADYNLYFGDLHAHTDYSDGTGTPEDAYGAAYAAALPARPTSSPRPTTTTTATATAG